MRYEIQLDHERLEAGWGRHCWVIDTEYGERLCLLPEREAQAEADRLNALAEQSGLIGVVNGLKKLTRH